MDIGAILQRRNLIGGVGALALTIATGGCERLLEELAARPTRRNISNLAPNDPILQTFRRASWASKLGPCRPGSSTNSPPEAGMSSVWRHVKSIKC
jgi:hypothetical protein